MYPSWQARNVLGGSRDYINRDGSTRDYTNRETPTKDYTNREGPTRDYSTTKGEPRYDDYNNGGSTSSWLKEVDDRKKNWNRDPSNGAGTPPWKKEYPNGYSSVNANLNGLSSGKNVTSLNKANSNLWNRRRTNSTNSIPTLCPSNNYRSQSPTSSIGSQSTHSPVTSSCSPSSSSVMAPSSTTRGSSASPRMPHTTGFWVQEPEDIHQTWVKTDTPDTNASLSTLTSPTSAGVNGSRHKVPLLPPTSPSSSVVGSSAAQKVFKTQATWVS